MTRKKVKVLSIGRMAENTKVAGRTESNTETEITLRLVVKSNKEDGRKARDSSGLVNHKGEKSHQRLLCSNKCE